MSHWHLFSGRHCESERIVACLAISSAVALGRQPGPRILTIPRENRPDLRGADQYEEGFPLITKAVRLPPVHPAYYLWFQGKAYYMAGRLAQVKQV